MKLRGCAAAACRGLMGDPFGVRLRTSLESIDAEGMLIMSRSDRELLAAAMMVQAGELSSSGNSALAKGLRRRAKAILVEVRASLLGRTPQPRLLPVRAHGSQG